MLTRIACILALLLLGFTPVDATERKVVSNTSVEQFPPFLLFQRIKLKFQKEKPIDIRNLFLFFPDSVFNINSVQPSLSLAERQEILLTSDWNKAKKKGLNYVIEQLELENNYLKFRSIGKLQGEEIELRYWKTSDKHQIVAVNIRHWNHCCSHSEIRFYDYYDYDFREVTAEVYPAVSLDAFSKKGLSGVPEAYLNTFAPTLQLPRFGKDIRVRIHDSPVFATMPEALSRELEPKLDLPFRRLVWRKDRFLLK